MVDTAKTGQDRTDRKVETREAVARQKAWAPPSVLPDPDPENMVEGYAYRWVRVAMNGNVDASNVSAKLREGWEPVKASDHPEIELVAIENSRFKDNIVIGGLMLCRAPVEMVEQRQSYYDGQTQNQMRAVNANLMRENNPRMPLFNESKSSVAFGSGN